MNRHQALTANREPAQSQSKSAVALLILLTMTACAQTGAAPVQAPNAPYSRDDNGIRPEHGGGDGGGGSGM